MEEPFLSFQPQSALPFCGPASVSEPEQDQACFMGQAVTDKLLFDATSHQPLQSQQQSSATDLKLPPRAAQHESSTAPQFVCSNFCPTFISTPVRGEVNINKKSFDQLRRQFSDTTEEAWLLKIQLDMVKQMYQDQQLKSEKLESENDKIKNNLKSLKSQNVTLLLEKKPFLASRAYKENCHLRSKVRIITSLLDSPKKKNGQLSNSVTFLQREKKKLQSDLSRLKKDKERLKRKREELDLDAVNQICKSSEFSTPFLRNGNRFTDAVRKTIIALQAKCNVSGSQFSKVIQVVAKELFNIEWNLKDLPSQQTVRDISDEAHVLSKILSAEKLSLDNFTLHIDGTSRDQRKFIGHQPCQWRTTEPWICRCWC
ncbi:hypothetical protein PoB_003289400 [Plakobranchus ocellatus]|uniref:Uncharacterized protein n=1 Tax=Plakobranchus ocellatus TaxID=259542 RepID=A0AAV4AJH3_9GAST|nr:hypothetical protein PoB_003289400 [Plakobranchus ocellatus]